MTLASKHVCFRSSWDHRDAAAVATRVVVGLMVSAGLPHPSFGEAAEVWEEALRALFVLHLFRDDRYSRREVAREVGMAEKTAGTWHTMMKAGPQMHRLTDWGERERAIAAVIERRLPHAKERARMEVEWQGLLDYNGIADEANIPMAEQYQLIQAYYARAGVRMNDREMRAFLSDRLRRPVSPVEVQPHDLRTIVESGNFVTADVAFIPTAEGFDVPVLIFGGGNPIRVLLLVICREGSVDIERGMRWVVTLFGKPLGFIHDDARGYGGRYPLRLCAALHIRDMNASAPTDGRLEGLITHLKDSLPLPRFLPLAEVPDALAAMELHLGPGEGELPFTSLSAAGLAEVRLSKRAVVLVRDGAARYLSGRLEGIAGYIDGQPVQVARMGNGLVALEETYGVMSDERGWSIKAGPSAGPLLLARSGLEIEESDLPDELVHEAEAERLAGELERVLPAELGGTFKRRRRQRRPRRKKVAPLPRTGGQLSGNETIKGGGGGGGGGGTGRGRGGGGTGGGGTGGGGGRGPDGAIPGAGPGTRINDEEGARRRTTRVPQVISLDDPRADELIRRSGADPEHYRSLAERGFFIALAPYAKGHPHELALAMSLDLACTHRFKVVVVVHQGELSYYMDESVIVDSLNVHSCIHCLPAHVSTEMAAMMQGLYEQLIRAAALVEDRQRCREMIGEILPQLEDLALEEGHVGEKMRNVTAHVERADSFLLAGHLAEAEGALRHAAYLMPVRTAA